MTFNVRLFTHTGVVTAPTAIVRQYSADSVIMLRQPYLSAQKLASNGATAVVSTSTPKGTKVLYVEVDDGNSIRYEVQPNGLGNVPSTTSPIMTGRTMVDCGENYLFAFVDASAV